MKTTHFAVLAVSLFLGGCGTTHLTNAMATGPSVFETAHTNDRDPHAFLDWNAAANPLAKPSRTEK